MKEKEEIKEEDFDRSKKYWLNKSERGRVDRKVRFFRLKTVLGKQKKVTLGF
jgi:hypothetical protein